MKNNYISYLVCLKILIASIILSFFTLYLGWDMFKYPDFYHTYVKCPPSYYPNILYGELFCVLNYITGKNFSHSSTIFIITAGFINMLLLIGYFKIFQEFLSKYGKFLFIALLAFHPYMSIYFFRFYTDLFASIGIFLILYYIMNNKRIDAFFIVSSIILINFRVALIPVFFIYCLFEIYQRFKSHDSLLPTLILLALTSISLISVLDFSSNFAQINAKVPFLEKIIFNLVFVFGFRESFVGVFRQAFWGGDPLEVSSENPALFFSEYAMVDYFSLLFSVFLLMIHVIGFYGILKFSKLKKRRILILFSYILIPIISIAHMRYLLPLIPILLFGFSYVFFKVSSEEI